jgi:hypothetical protein
MLPTDHGFARKLPVTWRQNEPRMLGFSNPAVRRGFPVVIYPRGLLMKSLKLIGLALGA